MFCVTLWVIYERFYTILAFSFKLQISTRQLELMKIKSNMRRCIFSGDWVKLTQVELFSVFHFKSVWYILSFSFFFILLCILIKFWINETLEFQTLRIFQTLLFLKAVWLFFKKNVWWFEFDRIISLYISYTEFHGFLHFY